ncbi:MAG: DUF3293 domain-containing protein, partial [Planctomycetaceae bacterium]
FSVPEDWGRSENRGFPREYFETRFRLDSPAAFWPVSFVIITAWQTTGCRWPMLVNQQSDGLLLDWLRGSGQRPIRLTGYSPVTGHAEPGWAVDLPLLAGLRLGQAFRQDAVYWVQLDELSIVRCASPWQQQRAGSFRERLG